LPAPPQGGRGQGRRRISSRPQRRSSGAAGLPGPFTLALKFFSLAPAGPPGYNRARIHGISHASPDVPARCSTRHRPGFFVGSCARRPVEEEKEAATGVAGAAFRFAAAAPRRPGGRRWTPGRMRGVDSRGAHAHAPEASYSACPGGCGTARPMGGGGSLVQGGRRGRGRPADRPGARRRLVANPGRAYRPRGRVPRLRPGAADSPPSTCCRFGGTPGGWRHGSGRKAGPTARHRARCPPPPCSSRDGGKNGGPSEARQRSQAREVFSRTAPLRRSLGAPACRRGRGVPPERAWSDTPGVWCHLCASPCSFAGSPGWSPRRSPA